MGDNDHLSAFKHSEMTGLIQFMDYILHDWQRFRDETLGGRIFERHAEHAEGSGGSVRRDLTRDVTPLFEAQQHAEDFRDCAIEAAGHVTLCKASRLMCK